MGNIEYIEKIRRATRQITGIPCCFPQKPINNIRTENNIVDLINEPNVHVKRKRKRKCEINIVYPKNKEFTVKELQSMNLDINRSTLIVYLQRSIEDGKCILVGKKPPTGNKGGNMQCVYKKVNKNNNIEKPNINTSKIYSSICLPADNTFTVKMLSDLNKDIRLNILYRFVNNGLRNNTLEVIGTHNHNKVGRSSLLYKTVK